MNECVIGGSWRPCAKCVANSLSLFCSFLAHWAREPSL
jgi:hypothetical protein